jgi:hypothetical protein
MRGLLTLSCRAFPRDHRARWSDEIIDTALLVAEGSALRTAREALSLVVAGARQRLRAETHGSFRDGATLLAGSLAVVNLAVALSRILSGFTTYSGPSVELWGARYGPGAYPFVIDPWWVAVAVAGAAVVFGLVRGHRWLAVGAATENLALVAYDASGHAQGVSHFNVFTIAYGFPGSRQWLAAAIVLAAATSAARPRRLPLTRLAIALVVVGLLVWLALLARAPRGRILLPTLAPRSDHSPRHRLRSGCASARGSRLRRHARRDSERHRVPDRPEPRCNFPSDPRLLPARP